MTTKQLLKLIFRLSGIKPRLLREDTSHQVWFLDNWTGSRPNAAENCQKGLFTLSLSQKKLDRAKVEAVLRDLGLKSPWHR